METNKLWALNNKGLIAGAIEADKKQKQAKKELDAYKAVLQSRGISIMENQNIKFVKFYGKDGTASIMDSAKIEPLNIEKLKGLLGNSVFESKVKKTEEIKYTFNARLDRCLKAIFNGDYNFEYTLDEFLDEMSIKPDIAQKKLLLKMLKGDYVKDRETLLQVFGYIQSGQVIDETVNAPDFDAELWFIYKIRNAELIRAFLPEEGIDGTMEQIKRCLIVDTKTSITLDYETTTEES